MKRLLALALVLLLLVLSACGGTEPDTATEIETTTEIETSEAMPADEEEPPVTIGTTEIFEKLLAPQGPWEIWTRDTLTGEEAQLIAYDEEQHLLPCLVDVINERYFLFFQAIFESDGSFSPLLYDMREGRAVQIEYPDESGSYRYCKTIDGKLYLVFAGSGLGVSGDVGLRVLRADLASAAGGGPVITEDVLKGVPEYDSFAEIIIESDFLYELSPDARYFAIHAGAENPALYVFDIAEQSLALKREMSGLTKVTFSDARTLHCFGDEAPVEIALPVVLSPLEI